MFRLTVSGRVQRVNFLAVDGRKVVAEEPDANMESITASSMIYISRATFRKVCFFPIKIVASGSLSAGRASKERREA